MPKFSEHELDIVWEWYERHAEGIDKSIGGVPNPMYSPADCNAASPGLWKTSHWRWFLQHYKRIESPKLITTEQQHEILKRIVAHVKNSCMEDYCCICDGIIVKVIGFNPNSDTVWDTKQDDTSCKDSVAMVERLQKDGLTLLGIIERMRSEIERMQKE